MSWLSAKYATFRMLRAKLGLRGALRHASRWLLCRLRTLDGVSGILGKRDIIAGHSFIEPNPFGEVYDPARHGQRTMNWVIPDFGIGSGGHLNIFRLILQLERHGFHCRVVILRPCQQSSAEAARQAIRRHFFPIAAEVSIGAETLKPAWATLATSWHTAYPVRDFRGSARKFYFVQDFEPYFFAHGSEYHFAEQTYRFGFHAITAGGWLAGKLAREYGLATHAYGFSYDHALYSPKPRRDPSQRQIFFYARPVTARRGFELGMLVLNEVSRRLPDVRMLLAGWNVADHRIPFPHTNAGMVALDQLADLYSQCDLALVISFTNLSLLPLELMACGCPVVSNTGANVEWLLDDSNAALAEPTVEALSGALVDLLEHPERLARLRQAALAFARATSWEREGERLVAHIEQDRHASAA